MDPATIGTCLFSFGMSMVVKLLKSRMRCSRISGIVLPSKGGASTMVERLAQSDNAIILDLNNNIEMNLSEKEMEIFKSLSRQSPSFAVHIYPLLKRYVQNVKKNFPHKKIIVVGSNIKELQYCGIKKGDILSFIPNTEFSNIIMGALMSETDKELFQNSRLELLLGTKEKLRNVYESYDDLQKKITAKYGLSVKI
jgi:hypothetical protein